MGKNYLGYVARDKVVAFVAFTVQDFYARLIGSAIQKLQAQNHNDSHGHVEDVNDEHLLRKQVDEHRGEQSQV